ncbi:MAG: heavy-metal-associated domain-containing protein [Prevotellaceae bacterium]|jgi:copper chaperone CopZ|nr:heavy-metal-associated domain-containing protein [Prevotellaceae bacterium]
MKTLKVLVSALALLFCVSLTAQNNASVKKSETVVFAVSEMHGEHCKNRIEKNVGFEKGVKSLVVDLKAETVTIKYDPSKTTAETLKQKLVDLGYPTNGVAPTTTKSCH